VATQTVELGLDLEKDKPVVVTLVGLFQPIECLSVVAEAWRRSLAKLAALFESE